MKFKMLIKLKTGIVLPVEFECKTLADMKKLGDKLSKLPAGANALIPGIRDTPVESLLFAKE